MMIQLTEFLPPRAEPEWALIRQAGVDQIIGSLNGGENDQRLFGSIGAGHQISVSPDDVPWGEAAIRRYRDVYAEYGFQLVGIEDTPPMDRTRLGLPGRDEEIDNIVTQVRAMGRLGIPMLCYDWMAISTWARTSSSIVSRGGALVTGFRVTDMEKLSRLAGPDEYTEDRLWDALIYFLNAVVPVAEEAGVRLAMHPDDPPRMTFRGIPRIMRSVAAYRRLVDLYPSISNAITFCQGNFALMEEADLPTLIREFGAKQQIAFVHFRDVKGTVDDFEETFHDDGKTDMAECIRAYSDIGYDGPMRPDHVPTLYGETNDRPGYEMLGRLFALGYIRGLQHALDTEG